ncbi:MAG: M23 family metallopeptidase [Desulfovibrio sp.]|uniref:M23 family metallopeptidase n=1 Tax=Desulfovibrio sp. 7SRBS1 TaxID=3378064 RepID=UPI003B3F202B
MNIFSWNIMRCIRVFFLQSLLLVCLLSIANSSDCKVLDAPDSIGIGQPFLVRLAFPYVADDVQVVWNAKSLHPSVENADGISRAIVLLGTPLKLHPARLQLAVKVRRKDKTVSYSKEIEIVEHPYQKETLTVAPKMVAPPKKLKERLLHERESALKAIYTVSAGRRWSVPFSLPVKGKMLSRYGLYRVFNNTVKARHKGQDFRAYLGTPICSIAPGKVVLVGNNFYFAGNCVYIDHGDGVVSSYAHMSKVLVKQGDMVEQGQEIGRSGATGRATGAHLHLSVFAQGVNVDPVPLFSMK